MSEIPEQFIHEARELLAVECERNGWTSGADCHRAGAYDNGADTRALARVLYERQQPTFEQRSLAMIGALNDVHNSFRSGHNMTVAYDRNLAEIMRPKVDPLVKWLMDGMQYFPSAAQNMGIIYLTPDNSSGSYLLMQRAIPPQPRGGCYAG